MAIKLNHVPKSNSTLLQRAIDKHTQLIKERELKEEKLNQIDQMFEIYLEQKLQGVV